MYKLSNPIKDYAWGSTDFIPGLLGYQCEANRPVAELWLGAHPASPSMVMTPEAEIPLDVYLKRNSLPPLPYLFKVLSAATPLSIQVHPTLAQAREGFARDNAIGVPLTSSKRNYKDANHKPEMMLALTEFHALCGIRPYEEIIAEGKMLRLGAWLPSFTAFFDEPSPDNLRLCFSEMLGLDPDIRDFLLKDAYNLMDSLAGFPPQIRSVCDLLRMHYPGDIGCIFPLFMNHLLLSPGEAVYLDAGTPHAYLSGSGLEIMANSDNVLRGGLTPKHIDIPEFLRICNWVSSYPLRPFPECHSSSHCLFTTPAEEFSLMLLTDPDLPLPNSENASILLCLDGSVNLTAPGYISPLKVSKGESVIYLPGEMIHCRGKAKLALAMQGIFPHN